MRCPAATRRSARDFRLAAAICGLAGLLLMMSAGCTRRVYDVDMTVAGADVERTLTASMAREEKSPALPTEEEAELAAAYGTAVGRDEHGRTQVTGTFSGRLPDDVGGRGELVRWDSSLGSLSVYLERFRGDDDLHAQFHDRIARVDRAVDLVFAWVDFAVVESDEADRLRAFVDVEFRRDVRNLALLVWISRSSDARDTSEAQQQQLQARLTQYALDHDYLELAEVPRWSTGQPDEVLPLLRKVIAEKLNIEDATALLPPLESVQAFRRSFDDEFRHSAAWRELLARHEWDVKERTTPSKLLGQLVFADVLGGLQSTDQLGVRLRIPHEPLATNGRWDGEGTIHWDATELALPGEPPRSPIPMVNFAVWSQPHPEAQQARFGRILLTDQALADYVFWRQSLSDEAAAEWEQFLSSLIPDEDFTRAVEAYRDSLGGNSPLTRGCELLLAAATQSSP